MTVQSHEHLHIPCYIIPWFTLIFTEMFCTNFLGIFVTVVILNGYLCKEIGIFPKFLVCNKNIGFSYYVNRNLVSFLKDVTCKVEYCFGFKKLFMYSEYLLNLINFRKIKRVFQ